MVCSLCGNEIKDGEKFCSVCGSPAGEEIIAPIMENKTKVEKVKIPKVPKMPKIEKPAKSKQDDSNIEIKEEIQVNEEVENKESIPVIDTSIYERPVTPKKNKQTSVSNNKTTLMIIMGIILIVLVIVIIILFIMIDKLSDKKDEKETIVTEETTDTSAVVEQPQIKEDIEEPVEEKEYIIAETNEADYLSEQVIDKTKYNFYKSGIKDFGFGYPASLFNSEYKSFDEAEGHYGTVIQEIHFSGSDGSFVNFVLSERTDSSTIEGMLTNAYAFERSFITDPMDLVYEENDNYGQVVMRGFTDDSKSAGTFNMTKVDDEYVMQMKLYYPQADSQEMADAIDYYIQSMYENCSFNKLSSIDLANADEVVVEDNSEYADDAVGYSEHGWTVAYFNYMQEIGIPTDYTEYPYASLIYVNDDKIPELLLEGNCEAVGYRLVTYKNGKVDVIDTNRLSVDYIERGNLVRNSSGHMGYYSENVYCIKDGKWKLIYEDSGSMDDDIPNSKYDDIFYEAYNNGTIGSLGERWDYEYMIDYLWDIDG